eukprot:3107918-Prymnesium_polylepis.1
MAHGRLLTLFILHGRYEACDGSPARRGSDGFVMMHPSGLFTRCASPHPPSHHAVSSSLFPIGAPRA